VVRASDLQPIGRRFDSRSLHVTTLGKLFTHMCLCSPSSINWYRPKGGDAMSNHKSGVALAMCHRLCGLNGLRQGDERPTLPFTMVVRSEVIIT